MNDLIEALELMRSRMTLDVDRPVHCEHDVLTVVGVDPNLFSAAEIERLSALGFFVDDDDACFRSFRFGSA